MVILRFWPILLPLAVYVLWILHCQRKARKHGKPVPAFRDGPWVWAVVACLLLAIGGFLWLGLTAKPQDGIYVPAHAGADGKLVPAHTAPKEATE